VEDEQETQEDIQVGEETCIAEDDIEVPEE